MLSPGTRLGPYEIVRPLGAGGMGEVYEAADRRLDRIVALKVLPPAYATDALRIRFQREAKAISALNHPHICTLHDVGEAAVDGQRVQYLVMEYCEGETLAERLRRGALPIRLALEYGAQLAEALASAHRAGIIHRDIKPGNVVLTASGVKLLDFGLARRPTTASSSTTLEATSDQPLTSEGHVAGTLDYMAPELLAGGDPDERSDLFALGMVLYEVIEGKRPRDVKNGGIVAPALLGKPPPFSTAVPLPVIHLVEGCLRLDPDERRQSAADLALDLRWAAAAENSGTAGAGKRAAKSVAWAASLATAGLAAALIFVLSRPAVKPLVPRRITSFAIPAEVTISSRHALVLSPDGRSLVFASPRDGPLYLYRFDRDEVVPVPGTAGAISPFFSPDSNWIGFTQRGALKKVPLSGGDVETIFVGFAVTASWGPNGVIVVAGSHGLFRLSASGGIPVRLTHAPEGEYHLDPSFLPGGRTVLFESVRFTGDPNDSMISAVDVSSGRISPLIKGGFQPRYSPTGHLLFLRTATADVRSGTLFSVDFDPVRLRVTGDPKPRVTELQSYPIGGYAFFDVAPDGAIAYVPHNRALNERELVWFDRSGRVTPAGGPIKTYDSLALSPDGQRIAVSNYSNLWIGTPGRDDWVKIAAGGIYDNTPVWSPDGKRVVFSANPKGGPGLYVSNADGSGTPTLLMKHAGSGAYPSSWSPDGKTILYECDTSDFGWQTRKVDVATGRSSTLLTTRSRDMNPTFSPDGRWVAWESQNPESQVYAAPYPSLTPRSVLGTGAPCAVQGQWCVAHPRWSRDGREIFYKAGDRIMAVDVDTTSGTFRSGTPRILFQSDFEVDVSPDGRRFIAPRFLSRPRWDHINLLTGWWDQR